VTDDPHVERRALLEGLTGLMDQYCAYGEQRLQLIAMMEGLADPSPFLPDLRLLTAEMERINKLIEEGQELLGHPNDALRRKRLN
jgi:hypothetical protein